MYRLVLYYLIFLALFAIVLSFFGLVPFSPISIALSSIFLVVICVATNLLLGYFFKAPVNFESSYISALILALIMTPATSVSEYGILFAAGLLSQAGKYILPWKRKHIFNPAAVAVVVTGLALGGYASWWVGTTYMLPALLFGILIPKKLRRFEEVFAFFGAAFGIMILLGAFNGNDLVLLIKNALTESPLLFFAFVMFTEPITSPTRRLLQIIYGVVVGSIYSSQLIILGFFVTPEIALLVGNLFAYFVGMKSRLVLKLKTKANIGSNIYEFVFDKPKKFSFIPGQYLEWTLNDRMPDVRGNRRYFTIASSPTEDNIRLGVRIEEKGSSFKQKLADLAAGATIDAGQISGDFVLPADKSQKLVFIAGGIGITPYRAIVKYLTDKQENRDVVLLYINKIEKDEVYKDIFKNGEKIGLKTFYLLERVDADKVKSLIPDYHDRKFYISGSHAMVEGNKEILNALGVKGSSIVTDYFPGYA